VSLDAAVVAQVTEGLERAYESGRLLGQQEAEAAYYGKSARVLTGTIFSAAFETAAQALRPHDPEAADFFHAKAAELTAWVTPPRVQSHEPADGATGIVPTNAISVKFVAPGVRAESVTPDTFYVTPASGGQHLSGEVVYDETTTTATFTPSNPLADGVEYKVTLGPEITAVGGLTLGAPATFNFTTAVT
jgi:hypothetical protein